MKTYQLLIDQWEGSMDINEDALMDTGVVGAITRINSISGGHHLDDNFQRNYDQCAVFPVPQVIYFVYNPWKNGRQNFEYLMSVCPASVYCAMIDVEVRYTGITKAQYAEDVDTFMQLVHERFAKAFIYTGAWFYSELAYWPDCDYCLARYPYVLYPDNTQTWTWEQVRAVIENDEFVWNPGTSPKLKNGSYLDKSKIKLWQCSGDRLILPGTSGKCIDIVLWNGDLESLQAWAGVPEESHTPPPPVVNADLAPVYAEIARVAGLVTQLEGRIQSWKDNPL